MTVLDRTSDPGDRLLRRSQVRVSERVSVFTGSSVPSSGVYDNTRTALGTHSGRPSRPSSESDRR